MPFTTISKKILCENLLPLFPLPSSPTSTSFAVPTSISYYEVLFFCVYFMTSCQGWNCLVIQWFIHCLSCKTRCRFYVFIYLIILYYVGCHLGYKTRVPYLWTWQKSENLTNRMESVQIHKSLISKASW